MLPVYFWQVEVPHRNKGQFTQKCPLVPQINSLASRVRTTPETGHKAEAEKKPLCALLHQLLGLFINSVVCSKMLEEEHFLLTLTMQTDPSQVQVFPFSSGVQIDSLQIPFRLGYMVVETLLFPGEEEAGFPLPALSTGSFPPG